MLSTKSTLENFNIIIVLALVITTIVVGSLAATTQPALAKRMKSQDKKSSITNGKEQDNGNNNADTELPSSNNHRPDQQECRQGDVLQDVYDPERLKLLSSCVEAIGTVEDKEVAHDDDIKLYLKPDNGYEDLVNGADLYDHPKGLLVVEIVPADQDSSMIQIPQQGDRVRIVGAWVTDEGAGGWNEIHPAWKVEILR
jgi:hypothetical protein